MSAPSPWSFTFEPVFLAIAVAAAVLYARRARSAGAARTIVFALGLVCIALPLNSPLETIASHYLLLAHLAQNAIIADIAPPLLILGLPAETRDAIVVRGGAVLAGLTRPAVALPIWLACWYGIHLAPVYDALLTHPHLLNVEHAVLICAGLVFWWPVLAATGGRLTPPIALLYLFAAFVTSVFLGLGLTWLPSFYPYYQHTPRLWGLSPDEDQNLGGALMMAEQSFVLVSGMCWVFFRLLDPGAEDDQEAGDQSMVATR
ncbi:MAG TPA: cytochrome c oxidase assembly protein [Gaiellales bacterium]